MNKYFILIFTFCFSAQLFCQSKQPYTLKSGISAEYFYSGKTNSFVAGPLILWEREKGKDNAFLYALSLNAGLYWGKHVKTNPVTAAGLYIGNLPGFIFGISSQQYYNNVTINNDLQTDIRLSGEILFAFWGFIGYRFQQPLLKDNESKAITRHAFIVRMPIPLKTLSRK